LPTVDVLFLADAAAAGDEEEKKDKKKDEDKEEASSSGSKDKVCVGGWGWAGRGGAGRGGAGRGRAGRGGAEKDVMYLYNNNIYTYVFTCCSTKKKTDRADG